MHYRLTLKALKTVQHSNQPQGDLQHPKLNPSVKSRVLLRLGVHTSIRDRIRSFVFQHMLKIGTARCGI